MLNIAKRFKNIKLTEAKADTQKLIDFAGLELANRFLAIKNRLKAPESDLYYWVKNKTVDDLEQAVIAAEQATASKRITKSKVDEGAKLVAESDDWKVYHITSFEASQKYGRDTQWCITGINDYGDKYWNQYTKLGVKFYFFITKHDYNHRGSDSKFAIALYPNDKYEVFDQRDSRAHLRDIENIEEVSIPGLDLLGLDGMAPYSCSKCDCDLEEDEVMLGADDDFYCEDCFYEDFFFCSSCDRLGYIDDAISLVDGRQICKMCFDDLDYMYCDGCEEAHRHCTLTAGGDHFCDTCLSDHLASEDGYVDRLIQMVEIHGSIYDGLYTEDNAEAELAKVIKAWREAKQNNKISEYSKSEIEAFEKRFIELAKEEYVDIDPASFNESLAKKLKESLSIASEFRLYENLWN
jgi:hypothetical protein